MRRERRDRRTTPTPPRWRRIRTASRSTRSTRPDRYGARRATTPARQRALRALLRPRERVYAATRAADMRPSGPDASSVASNRQAAPASSRRLAQRCCASPPASSPVARGDGSRPTLLRRNRSRGAALVGGSSSHCCCGCGHQVGLPTSTTPTRTAFRAHAISLPPQRNPTTSTTRLSRICSRRLELWSAARAVSHALAVNPTESTCSPASSRRCSHARVWLCTVRARLFDRGRPARRGVDGCRVPAGLLSSSRSTTSALIARDCLCPPRCCVAARAPYAIGGWRSAGRATKYTAGSRSCRDRGNPDARARRPRAWCAPRDRRRCAPWSSSATHTRCWRSARSRRLRIRARERPRPQARLTHGSASLLPVEATWGSLVRRLALCSASAPLSMTGASSSCRAALGVYLLFMVCRTYFGRG